MIRGIDQPRECQPEAPVDIAARLNQAYAELAEAEERLANAEIGMAYTLAYENHRLKRHLAETWQYKAEELVLQMLVLSGLLKSNRTLNENGS